MKLALILLLGIAVVSSFTTVNRNANDESDFEMGSEDYDDLTRNEGSQEGDRYGSGSEYEMGSEDYEDLMRNELSKEGDRSGSGFSDYGSGTQ
jgi:hypothetical protein